MKKSIRFFSFIASVNLIAVAFVWFGFKDDPQYVLLAWNDLGMHCSNKDFSKIAILPPYNNIRAQAVQVGTVPVVITTDYHVTFEIPGNTYSVDKTNFWTYDQQLFGVNLSDNVGLEGFGLSGTMNNDASWFYASGVPVTPYQDTDLVAESPYQLGLFKLYDAGNNLLATTQNVIPVSNEIGCVSSGCHPSEQSILDNHPDETLTAPVLCASCHADNALGTTGNGDAPVFSEAIHSQHGGVTNNCYKCHPGTNTQCYRDAMLAAGKICQDCHGSVSQVGSSVESGREPWLQEPSCSQTSCHGSDFAPNAGLLFRQSKGHGGLYCSACHGSPHAIVPTNQFNDNIQNITLQGYNGTLDKCSVCHGYTPAAAGPHNIVVGSMSEVKGEHADCNMFLPNYPNPVNSQTTLKIMINESCKVNIDIFSPDGKRLFTVLHRNLKSGVYEIQLDTGNFASGLYYAGMKAGSVTDSQKILVIR